MAMNVGQRAAFERWESSSHIARFTSTAAQRQGGY